MHRLWSKSSLNLPWAQGIEISHQCIGAIVIAALCWNNRFCSDDIGQGALTQAVIFLVVKPPSSQHSIGFVSSAGISIAASPDRCNILNLTIVKSSSSIRSVAEQQRLTVERTELIVWLLISHQHWASSSNDCWSIVWKSRRSPIAAIIRNCLDFSMRLNTECWRNHRAD